MFEQNPVSWQSLLTYLTRYLIHHSRFWLECPFDLGSGLKMLNLSFSDAFLGCFVVTRVLTIIPTTFRHRLSTHGHLQTHSAPP